jgi:putative ABC transport system permease protein
MKISILREILKTGVHFAFTGLRTNMLRTFLSTLGVIIGVFTIIAILTFIHSLNKSIKDSLSELGGDVLYVQKWPWLFAINEDYPWWKFINRPEADYREMKMLEKRSENIKALAYIVGIPGSSIAYNDEEISNSGVFAVTHDYLHFAEISIAQGRYFSAFESETGDQKVIIGHQVANELFRNKDPIGEKIHFLDRKFTVIGVLQKQGNANSIFDFDSKVIIPNSFARYLYGSNIRNLNPSIMVKGKEGISIEALEDEVRGIMRSVRKIKPGQEDNFAINKASMINSGISQIFSVLRFAGWIIAAFSILVGGFGTANIMFVSVKERTFIIGIEKALGSPRYFIMSHFLMESIILCVVGGISGILLVLLTLFLVNISQNDIVLVLSLKNALIGIGLSTGIGVLAGIFPAYQASRLDPVEAIGKRV